MGKRWANAASVVHLAGAGYAIRPQSTASVSRAGAAKFVRRATANVG